MSSITWTSTESGLWSDPSNWSGGVAPQTGDDVKILQGNGPSVTVTYATATLILDSLQTAGDTLSVTGGELGTANGYSFGGAVALGGGELRLVNGAYGGGFFADVAETAGTLALYDGAQAQFGTFSETGGVLSINGGNFVDQDGGTFSSVVNGGGRLVLDSGSSGITLGSGFSIATSMEIEAGDVVLSEALTDAKLFALDQNTTLSLTGGEALVLTGTAGLDGDITGGTLDARGTGHLNGLLLDNGQLLSLTGTYNQTGAVVLGNTGSGTLAIGTTGALRLTNNGTIYSGAGGGVLTNAGLLEKVGGGSPDGQSTIFGDFSNTGVVDVAVGTLDFHGPSNGFTNSLAGTIEGAGTVSFDAGSFMISSKAPLVLTVDRLLLTGSANMTLTTALTYNGDWDQTGGTLAVGSPGQAGGTLTLGGTDALEGGLLKGTGTVLSSGAVTLGGNMDLEGNLTFDFNGPVSQTSNINLGLDNDAITIASIKSGESWNIEGSASIFGFNGEISNAGTLAKANGAGTSVVQSDLISTGKLAIDTGALDLSGVGTLGGSVVGGAVLAISGAYQFASGLALSVGTVILDYQQGEVQATLGTVSNAASLTFANNWAQEGGTLALLDNSTLTLEGVASFLSGAIEGEGTVVSNGPAVLGAGFNVLQGAQVAFNGATEQTGNVTLTGGSSAPVITIGTGSTYVMDANADLGGPNNSLVGTLVVDGTLSASGAGLNVIAASVVDSGKIALSYGEMQFLGSLAGKGSVTISNGATFDLLGSSTVTNTISFGGGGGILDLGTPSDFAGKIAGFNSGDMVELTGFQFGNITPVVQGDTVTITDAGQSVTLTFSTAQTASQLMVGEGPHGWLALIHL